MDRRLQQLTRIAFALSLAFGCAGLAGADTKSGTTTTVSAGTTSGTSSTTTVSAGQTKVIGKTADSFTLYAGSRSNAESLATGLRTGSEITLTGSSAGQTTRFTPPTRPMGYGNVDKALALSSQQLAAAGVAQPTPDQIRASLMGGTITNDAGQRVTLQGVLQMRADGMGWGQIAHQLGIKPGQGYRSAYTASGVHVARATTGSAGVSGKSGGTGGSQMTTGSSSARSGIVTAAGAMSGQGAAHASSKGTGHRSEALATAAGGSVTVIQGGEGHGGVVSAAGGTFSNGGGGGLARGHAK